jgi:phosphatidylserine/phosphatidylglycerophosphate/cardiolipin synthase-like enzyme
MQTTDAQITTLIAGDFVSGVVPLIDSARESISILVFDWRWYPDALGTEISKFNQAIASAVRRGVRVQSITNNRKVPETLKARGVDARFLIQDKLMHAKIMLIDSNISIVGSHNYTNSGVSLNHEVSLVVDSPVVNLELSQYFTRLWQSSIRSPK